MNVVIIRTKEPQRLEITAEDEKRAKEKSEEIILTVNFQFLCETRLLCYRDKQQTFKKEFRDMLTMTQQTRAKEEIEKFPGTFNDSAFRLLFFGAIVSSACVISIIINHLLSCINFLDCEAKLKIY